MFTTWSTNAAFWAAIALKGSPACPTVDAVMTALDSLVAEGGEPVGSAHVELLEEVDSIRVTRRNAFGVIEAEKAVNVVQGDCPRAAEEIALLIALWNARLDSGMRLDLPDPELSSTITAPGPGVNVALRAVGRAPATWSGDAALGVLAANSGSSFTPALTVATRFHSTHSKVGAIASVVVIDDHAQDLAVRSESQVHWRQVWVGLGPSFALHTGTRRVHADLQVNTGLSFVRGSGLDRNLSGATFELGGRGGLAVAFGARSMQMWLGSSVAIRARQQDIRVGGERDLERLPTVELLVGGGVLFSGIL